MYRGLPIVVLIFLANVCFAAESTPPEKYEVLIGEDFAGSGFVIRHGDGFLGVASLHQFGGKTPSTLFPLEGEIVHLIPEKVRKQKDVQILPVKSPGPKLSFLNYEWDFTLRAGDEVIVLGPEGDCVTGILAPKGMTGGIYKSAEGPATLEVKLSRPIVMSGGSGGPVLLKKSGAAIGVILTADDGEKAQVVGFETLCLPKVD